MDESSKICGFFLRIFFGKWILFSKVPSPWNVGIFLLRFARKNLEETNAAVRIRNHVATSTISEKAVAFLFSAKFQLCEDVLQVELHNSFRLTSRFLPWLEEEIETFLLKSNGLHCLVHFYLKPYSIFILKAWSCLDRQLQFLSLGWLAFINR